MSHAPDPGSFVAQLKAEFSPGAPLAQSGHDSSATIIVAAIEDRRAADHRLPCEVAADITLGNPVVADARPIDISQTGILVETTTRLPPGGAVELVLQTNGEYRILSATVVRSSVSSLTPTVFRTAFNFDHGATLPERKLPRGSSDSR